jgi:hypothetical protein
MSERNIENETSFLKTSFFFQITIKTKKVRFIKSFFSAPKKIKLEVNNASDFYSSSDGKFF